MVGAVRRRAACTFALFERTHAVMGGDGLVHCAVQLGQRGGHLVGLGFAQPRRALDVGPVSYEWPELVRAKAALSGKSQRI